MNYKIARRDADRKLLDEGRKGAYFVRDAADLRSTNFCITRKPDSCLPNEC